MSVPSAGSVFVNINAHFSIGLEMNNLTNEEMVLLARPACTYRHGGVA